MKTPITSARVVVRSVIRTLSDNDITPRPLRKTMTMAIVIYTHINPKIE